MNNMTITILNQHTNNFGDEAAGISLIDTLNEKYNFPEINIIYNGDGKIQCKYSNVYHKIEYKLKYMGYINILFKIFFKNFKGNKTMQKYDELMRKSDYIFIAPCGANIGIYKDWRFLIRILFAIYNNKTPIFYLNTIGKSGNFLFDKISIYVLKHSKVYVREFASHEYLNNIGIKNKLGIDTAFLFKHNYNGNIDNNKICIVLSDVTGHKNFKNIDGFELVKNYILPSIIEYAQKEKKKISFLPHLNSDDELKFLKKVCYYIEQQYKFNNYEITKIMTVNDYYDEIASSRFVVGMRYHAAVLAAKSFTPFISLAYENKMIEVSNYTKMNNYCRSLYNDLESLNLNYLLKSIDINNDVIRIKLKNNIRKIKYKAELPLSEINNEK